jgi:hypothetical protein
MKACNPRRVRVFTSDARKNDRPAPARLSIATDLAERTECDSLARSCAIDGISEILRFIFGAQGFWRGSKPLVFAPKMICEQDFVV